MMKKWISMLLAVLIVFGAAQISSFAKEPETMIPDFGFSVFGIECGQDPADCPPDGYTYPYDDAFDDESVTIDSAVWIAGYDEATGDYQPLETPFVGGQAYAALIVLDAAPGFAFGETTRVFSADADDEIVESAILRRTPERLTIRVEVRAEHEWDTVDAVRATCVSEGYEERVCTGDPSHTETEILEIDPDAHDWGEWTVLREPTKALEGERTHTCALCGAVENEAIAKITYPYTPVYEPETSWSMAATVAWRADGTALETAKAEERPATCFVWLDKDLKVYDRNGALLSESPDDYVDATVGGMIPAFYIRDAETARALKAWLPVSGLLDCFVVSTPEHKDLVKDVADLLHIRGMLDYTAVKDPDRAALVDMIASTNGAHGKIILLSAEAATRENVRKLQSLASTVWVRTGTDTRALLTAYTNGVNGVVVDDYAPALDALRFFADDAPSLLRIPFIIGHRGDPSSYVENTLASARGAFEEGADSIENDIHLSTDGELFIYHDDTGSGLLGLVEPDNPYEGVPVESLSLAELQKKPFSWDRIVEQNVVTPPTSRYGTFYGQEEELPFYIPTLRDYIEEFKGRDVVHDTEIKSMNPDILPVYKAMVDEYDAWDQFFTITFNGPILDAMYRDYPEMSAGALGMGEWTDVAYPDYTGIAAEEGAEKAVELLYGNLDRWNATYNGNYGEAWGREMVLAARHRGLTTWPWTYQAITVPGYDAAQFFADDYLFGATGLTCNDPWIASDFLVEIRSADTVLAEGETVPQPVGVTQAGEEKPLPDAELVKLEDLSDRAALMIWRCAARLEINGESKGNYYLYSNPFTVVEAAENPFEDVADGAYYRDPVLWAINRAPQITRGVDETHFRPDGTCTRAQAVTFLWRAKGCPEPEGTVNPFTDVSADAYYYKAVLWALENGITTGTSADKFSPDSGCTRAQVVTFLWRMAREPEPERTGEPFADVKPDAYYGKAVLWAVENDITRGTSETRFSPDAACTRGQIVTFLYRAMA